VILSFKCPTFFHTAKEFLSFFFTLLVKQMSSIYNTSRTDKGKGRAVPRRGGGGPMRPGVGPQRMLQQHQLQMQQQQQQTEDITYSEFQLVSTSKRGKNHLMDFKGGSKHVDNTFRT